MKPKSVWIQVTYIVGTRMCHILTYDKGKMQSTDTYTKTMLSFIFRWRERMLNHGGVTSAKYAAEVWIILIYYTLIFRLTILKTTIFFRINLLSIVTWWACILSVQRRCRVCDKPWSWSHDSVISQTRVFVSRGV